MTAKKSEMDALSEALWKKGVAAICPTTLSSPAPILKDAVRRLGEWIRSDSAPGAKPLGIHLEGPFISPNACGAHPTHTIRPLTFTELEDLWEASQATLKILTIAPETLLENDLARLTSWAKKNRVRLSLGHSKCTEAQARHAFQSGFSGVTHAWNALAYHHREAGALGAAFGNPRITTELIIDQVHVSPRLLRWTLELHPKGVVFVSDAAPAAGLPEGQVTNFGGLKCMFKDGAARLENGALAGGGLLLPEAFANWLKTDAKLTGEKIERLWKQQIDSLTKLPLKSIQISEKALKKHRVEWTLTPRGEIRCQPLL